MTNEARHPYKINHLVASVLWREAELFGTYGYFDDFKRTVRMLLLQAAKNVASLGVADGYINTGQAESLAGNRQRD